MVTATPYYPNRRYQERRKSAWLMYYPERRSGHDRRIMSPHPPHIGLYIAPAYFKQDTRYACAVGTIRAMETSLINRQSRDRLLEASDAEELYKILSDTDYARHLADSEGIYEFEDFLTKELIRVLEILNKISPDHWWINLFCRRYDFHNLKVLFKARVLGEDPALALSPAGLIDTGILRNAVEEGKYDGLPMEIKKAALCIEEQLEAGKDLQDIDILADYALYVYLCQKTASDIFLRGLIRIYCDMINVKTLLRIRSIGGSLALLEDSLLPEGELPRRKFIDAFGGDTSLEDFAQSVSSSSYAEDISVGIGDFIRDKTFSTLEKLTDNFIIDYLAQSRTVSFGKEPLVNYLLVKENEIKMLRIILVGKLNHIPTTVIRDRLRIIHG